LITAPVRGFTIFILNQLLLYDYMNDSGESYTEDKGGMHTLRVWTVRGTDDFRDKNTDVKSWILWK
jgi:hypothetical protein